MSPQFRWINIVGFIFALEICLFGFCNNYEFFHDDAFITLKYVDNFIHGNGIVWNPGEYVEGYTSFLQLLIISVFGKLGFNLFLASRVVGVIAFLALGFFTFFYIKRYDSSILKDHATILKSVPLILTITTFPLIVWTLGGLEGPLFTFFCTAGIFLFATSIDNNKNQNQSYTVSALFLALACVTRPEGVIISMVTFFYLIYLLVRNGGYQSKPVLAFIVPFLCLLLPHVLWRVWYYGDLLPNTFYAKATSLCLYNLSLGLQYILAYLKSPPFLLLALCFAVPYAIFKGIFNRKMAYLLIVILVYLLFIVCVGGDHMPAFRFILPLIPTLIFLLYWVIQSLCSAASSTRTLCIYVAILCIIALQIRSNGINPQRRDGAAFYGKIVGQYIADNWPKGSLIALNTAGSTPYYAPNNRFIDMLGLNDVNIAKRRVGTYRAPYQEKLPGHAKGDGAYVLARKPDFIIIGPSQGATIASPWFLSDLEISEDPQFWVHYELKQVSIDVSKIKRHKRYRLTNTGSFTFTYYQRKHERA